MKGFARISLVGRWSHLFVKVDREDLDRVSKLRWHGSQKASGIYAVASIRGRRIYMHAMLSSPGADHRNGDTLDNRKGNLRSATHQQNMFNMKKWTTGRAISRYRGVIYEGNRKFKLRKPWRAKIMRGGYRVHIGYFKSERAAGRAYDEKARELFGEFAALNFPRRGEQGARR